MRILLALALGAPGSSAIAEERPMPWAFVNGSAEGYSVKLESVDPEPGTPLRVGQSVEFKVTVSYILSIKDSGTIILVVQDEANKNLLGDKPQPLQSVNRGKGTTTLDATLTVPSGSKEVRLFIPLVPTGLSNTSGELLVRYPIMTEKNTSSIGYPSVSAALADLHSRPEVKFSAQNGWTVAEDRANSTFWSFPPEGDPAYPSAVKRTAVQTGTGVNMEMSVLCQSTQAACDKLVADFNALNERVRDSLKVK
jgi:hypothetical protein